MASAAELLVQGAEGAGGEAHRHDGVARAGEQHDVVARREAAEDVVALRTRRPALRRDEPERLAHPREALGGECHAAVAGAEHERAVVDVHVRRRDDGVQRERRRGVDHGPQRTSCGGGARAAMMRAHGPRTARQGVRRDGREQRHRPRDRAAARPAGRLAAEGARVLMVARDAERLESAADAVGADWVAADVTDAEADDRIVATCAEQMGGIDVLVNNAGTSFATPLDELTDDDWNGQWELHVLAPMRLMRAAAPRMAE